MFMFVKVLLASVKLLVLCKSDVSAVQGHPRSLILVPFESAYATSYMFVIVNSVLYSNLSYIYIARCYAPYPTHIPA